MERFESLRRRFDVWTRWTAIIAFTGLLIVAIATMGDVLLRWLFNAPVEGLEDASLLLFAVIVIACLPAGLMQGHNVTIRFLGKGLGRAADHWLEVFGALLTFIFFAFVAWQFVVLAGQTHDNNDTSMTVGIPTWPWWAVCAALLAFCVVVQAVVVSGHFRRAHHGRGPGGTVELEMGAHEAGARAAEEAGSRRDG